MARHLLAFMPRPGSDWEFVQAGAATSSARGSRVFPDKSDTVTVVVPSTDISVHTVRIAGGKRADILQAARFEVEDEISEPVESLHVAVSKRDDSSGYDVCLVSHAVVETWVERLRDAGLENARLVPDVTLLPEASAPLDIGDRVLVIEGQRRYAVDKQLPPALVKALLDDDGVTASRPDEPLQAFSDFIAAGSTGLDLRQGVYAKRTEAPVSLSRFRLPLTLAAALAVAWLGYTVAETYTARKLNTVLDRQSADLFSSAYPGKPVPANLLAAVRERSAVNRSARADFRQMSSAMYAALARSSAATLSSLRFDGDAGQMRVALVYASFGDDQALKTDLERMGFSVRLGETRMENDLVVGDMTLEWGS